MQRWRTGAALPVLHNVQMIKLNDLEKSNCMFVNRRKLPIQFSVCNQSFLFGPPPWLTLCIALVNYGRIYLFLLLIMINDNRNQLAEIKRASGPCLIYIIIFCVCVCVGTFFCVVSSIIRYLGQNMQIEWTFPVEWTTLAYIAKQNENKVNWVFPSRILSNELYWI